MCAPLDLGSDVIGLKREAVSLSRGCEKRGQYDTRLATIAGACCKCAAVAPYQNGTQRAAPV
jgi:hypothetical protein